MRFLLAAALALAAPAALADRADPSPGLGRVKIRSLSYAGTGCPAGSVAGHVSEDAKQLALAFDAFLASAHPGVPLSERRRNCQVALDLTIPPNLSLAIVDLRAGQYWARLRTPADSATIVAASYYSGQANTLRLQSTVRGPVNGNVVFADRVLDERQLLWTPCGATRALNLNLQVRVDGQGGYLAHDAIDDASKWVFGLKWRRCP